jgi:hypothetical protein
MRLGNVLSGDHLMVVGMAAGGAIAGGLVQGSVTSATLNPTLRDLLLVGAALVLVGMGSAEIRAFGLGVGAAAGSSLVRSQFGIG